MNKFYDLWSFVSSIINSFVSQVKAKEIFYLSIHMRDIRKYPTILML